MALARWTATAQDAEGNAVAGCSIEVRSEDTGRLVQVYADRTGTVALGNPFVAPEATFGFHVEGGAYKVTATKGPFQSIWRYVAIGTASEFDYDQLISELQAGLMPVATFAKIDGQAPGVDQSLAAIVLADPDPTRNGYYLWDDGAGQWQRKRPLPDTLARLTLVGGTANALEALASPGVDPGAVLALFIDVPTANTGPVTLSINGSPALPVLDVNGDDFAPGVFTGRMFLSNEGDQLRALIGGDYMAAVAAAQAFSTQAALARDSSQRWAEGTAPGGAGTKSAREWAEQANPDNKLNRDGSNLVSAAEKGAVRAAIGGDLLGGFRNKIINGDFNIWQRGDGPFNDNAYGPDRWTGRGGQSVTPVEDAPEGQSGLAVQSVSETAGYSGVVQRIEGAVAKEFVGKEATLTFWARSSAGGSQRLLAELYTPNLEDDFSAVSAVKSQVVLANPLPPGWTKYTLKYPILPEQAARGLELRFLQHGLSGAGMRIKRVSLVVGDATAEDDPFSPRHIQQELALCQRYFVSFRSVSREIFPVSNAGATSHAFRQPLPVRMRVAPSISNPFVDANYSTGSGANAWCLVLGGMSKRTKGSAFSNIFAGADVNGVAITWVGGSLNGEGNVLFWGSNLTLAADAEL